MPAAAAAAAAAAAPVPAEPPASRREVPEHFEPGPPDDLEPSGPDDLDGLGDGDGDDGDGGDDGGSPARWVTVATFWQPAPAHVARLRLESQGIDCFLADENLVATDWLFANAVDGIKLQVPEPLARRAHELLSGPAAAASAAAGVAAPDEESHPDARARCPECGSDDMHLLPIPGRLIFLSILLLGLPLAFVGRRARCARCGAVWE